MMIIPGGFGVRCPTMNDSAVVLALIQEKERAEYGEVSTTEGSLRNEWQAPGFTLSTDAWVVTASDGQIMGYARVWHYQHIHIYLQFVVLPASHDENIKVLLLGLVEQRAHDYAELAPTESAVALRTGITDGNRTDQRVLVQAGYRKVRSRCRMETSLSEPPSPVLWPVGITVRSCAPEQDLHEIFATQEEAFARPDGYPPLTFEQWKRLTVPDEDFDPSLWFVAEEGTTMAGICLCSCSGSDGIVGTLAVRHPWRRKGLGQALLSHSFAALARRGMGTVRLFVDLGNPTGAMQLYERAGMQITQLYHQYEKEVRPAHASGNGLAAH
jgi:mycothiol synthase